MYQCMSICPFNRQNKTRLHLKYVKEYETGGVILYTKKWVLDLSAVKKKIEIYYIIFTLYLKIIFRVQL